MAGHVCYHCKEFVEEGEAHDCWTTTEGALLGGASEDLRQAYDRLRETASEFGEQRIYASHHCIMFARKACYFFVRPKRDYLELCVFLGRAVTSPLIKKAMPSSKTKWGHIIRLQHRDQVEVPLTDWLREAYELQDVTATSSKSTRATTARQGKAPPARLAKTARQAKPSSKRIATRNAATAVAYARTNPENAGEAIHARLAVVRANQAHRYRPVQSAPTRVPAPRSVAARLAESERLYREFAALTPFPYPKAFARTFKTWAEDTGRGAVPRRTPGSDNRVLLVCRLLNRRRARYLVVGGVAANLHGSVRATKDVDLLIPRDVDNAQRVLAALGELPVGISRELDAQEVSTRPFTIVGDMPRVDLLTVANSLTFAMAWPNRIVRRIQNVRVPYIGLDDLIRSKRTGRASDEADIEVLRAAKPAALRRASKRRGRKI